VSVTLQEVEDALASVPEVEGVLVVQVREDGSVKRLAQRDPVNNYPAQIVVLNDRGEAAARLRSTSGHVSRPSRPDPPAEPGDTPTDAERP
jgi:hypothetical protein